MPKPKDMTAKPAPTEPPKPKWTGPNGETWTEPGPNEPARARPGWLTKLQMDAVNAKPIPRAAFAFEPWQHRGGGAGLSVDGVLLSGRRPR
jgi:hypothetical protein